MKAAVLTGIRQMEITSLPDPRITLPTDVLLRVHTVGVCGSSVHYYTTGRIGSQVVKYPFPVGTEVKSCRENNIALVDSYVRPRSGELFLAGVHITPYEKGNRNNHEPRRERKLLMHRREIRKLTQSVETKGLTLVPLSFYLSHGKIKVEVGLVRGKQLYDKRESMKQKQHEIEARKAAAGSRR